MVYSVAVIEDLGIDPSLLLLLASLAVVTSVLYVWGVVRLFRAGHPIVGMISLFLPLFALLGFILVPTPESALYRRRRRRSQVLASGSPANQMSQSYLVAPRAPEGLPIGSEDPTQELPVIAPGPYESPDASPATVQPTATRRSGRRSPATWVWVSISIVVVGLVAAYLFMDSRYPSSVREITASVAELSTRAGSINNAWDTGEAPLVAGSSERSILYQQAEEALVELVADTVAVSRQASGINPPSGAPRDLHDEFVAAVASLNQHAEAMLAGLRLPGRSNKEPRQKALAAYQEATVLILDLGNSIAPP
jgi:hypothetical protein